MNTQSIGDTPEFHALLAKAHETEIVFHAKTGVPYSSNAFPDSCEAFEEASKARKDLIDYIDSYTATQVAISKG